MVTSFFRLSPLLKNTKRFFFKHIKRILILRCEWSTLDKWTNLRRLSGFDGRLKKNCFTTSDC